MELYTEREKPAVRLTAEGRPDLRQASPEGVAYALAHITERPLTQVARRAGLSLSTVYRLARQAGAPLDGGRDRKREGGGHQETPQDGRAENPLRPAPGDAPPLQADAPQVLQGHLALRQPQGLLPGDGQTRRTPLEDRAAARHGLRFLPADGEDGEEPPGD